MTKLNICVNCDCAEIWHSHKMKPHENPKWYGVCHSCSSNGKDCRTFKGFLDK